MPEQTARGGGSTPSAPGPRVTGSATIDGDIADILGQSLPWHDLDGATVLVTGAAGMIPAYAVYTLLGLNDVRDAGITVLALVRDPEKARRQFGPVADRSDLVLVQGDVRHPIEIDRRIDLVIHGASPARPALHAASPVDTIRANVTGAFGLLDLCVASGGARFVLMSSAEVYGQRVADGSLVAEDEYGSVDILNPRASYTEGKRAAETIAVSYHAQYGVPITIGRFGHIYGPGMALDDGRVQADFTADVLHGRDITLNSDGSARRTYTYLADAVSGMFAAILLGEDTAYNISDRDGFISIRELAEAFTQARPDKNLTVRFADGVDHSRYNAVKGQGLDDARLRGLGWAPHAGLRRGLDRTIAWHEERGEGATP